METVLRTLDEMAGSAIGGAMIIMAAIAVAVLVDLIARLVAKLGVPAAWLEKFVYNPLYMVVIGFIVAGLSFVIVMPIYILIAHIFPFLGAEFEIVNGERVPVTSQTLRASTLISNLTKFLTSLGITPVIAEIAAYIGGTLGVIGNLATAYGIYRWFKDPQGMKALIHGLRRGKPPAAG